MSEKIEVLVTLPISEELAEHINQVSDAISLTVFPARETTGIPEEIWEQTEVLYTMHTLPKPNQAPQLKWVQSYLSGVDKLLQQPLFLKEDSPTLTSISGANASQV
ncbi:MAG: hypothetical protein P8046_05070, partial [Anaerolineales bacterium]